MRGRVVSGLPRVVACGAALALSFAAARPARAFDNDLALEKLGPPVSGLRNGTEEIAIDPLAQERFARFASELALAVAPMPAGLASSLGDAGFEVSFSGDVALIHRSQVFSNGLSSTVWPTEKTGGDSLFVPTLHLRKGLPFSFEVGTDFGYVAFSSMIAATGSVKWAILEGFHLIPDLSVKAFATAVLGTGALNLVVGGWDVGASERIPLAGGAELGLFGGYQRIGINATTNNIDFNLKAEDEAQPTSDDSVFLELPIGQVFNPTTAFGRIYFGAQIRTALLVLGFDGSFATGENAIAAGSPTKYKIDFVKLAARVGVLF
jgi:hypothetical protein